MITKESFSRGIKYSVGNDLITQDLQIGIADLDDFSTDVNGATSLKLSESQSVGVFYGIRGSSQLSFKEGHSFFAGLEYKGSFGDVLSLKFDVGYNSLPGEERTNLTTLLLEPTLSFGSFTVAATAFIGLDDVDSTNVASSVFSVNQKITFNDEMFFYVEPGYTFNDYLGVGLPLEYHDPNIDIEKDGQFWVVPTFYIYPIENVQWWLWGQMVKYTAEDTDNAFGFGSEIIVTF